ncbi:MAG: hypothetical protein HOA08_14850 [Rhodospirillaceae bacterium]|jgi:hypothetical protein|nr:hypothetical protein [Rhodospirillaceae bacterium]MBT3494583.1 hypothetical protein [Rhodospirillaceae bacterium]MBT3782638.1 hypothetical protein [Rhodospirillaceae bacterium]MBT3974889.1 hypothetical protein [Rhodospirillaceae bacterium]MBT4171419.1 hypothetical protein [Rhodospirillaceae bacterium]
MNMLFRYAGQALVYLIFAAFLGYFASAPVYNHFPADKALIKLSLAHGAAREGGCRRRTQEELQKLAPNMRRPMDCPRQRLPVVIEFEIDGVTLYSASEPPTGLSGDGPSRIYQRFTVSAGKHDIVARLRDSDRTEGFDFEKKATIELKAQQSLAIDFRQEMGGFLLRW